MRIVLLLLSACILLGFACSEKQLLEELQRRTNHGAKSSSLSAAFSKKSPAMMEAMKKKNTPQTDPTTVSDGGNEVEVEGDTSISSPVDEETEEGEGKEETEDTDETEEDRRSLIRQRKMKKTKKRKTKHRTKMTTKTEEGDAIDYAGEGKKITMTMTT